MMESRLSIASEESINLKGFVPDWSPSVPLVELVPHHLEFLATVLQTTHLQKEEVLKKAQCRYELLWLPLCGQYREEDLEPPLDVHWMWHTHMLSPVAYNDDCNQLLGFVPDHKLRSRTSQEFSEAIARTEKLWLELYPDEPFVCDVQTESGDFNKNVNDYQSKLSLDLAEATHRQESFYYQVSLPHYRDEKFLTSGLDRYIKFIYVKKNHPDLFTVPMYDIDLLWHTHQLCPSAYLTDMTEVLGEILNHDDRVQDRAPGSKLTTASDKTRSVWYEMYSERMVRAGGCYRGLSLARNIHKDTLQMPIALRCMLQVEKLSLTGGQETDVIQARLCDNKNSNKTLLELPTIEGTPAVWAPGQYIMTDQLRGQPIGNVDLALVNRSGMWGTLVGTSLPTLQFSSDVYVEKRVPQHFMEYSTTEHIPRKLPLQLTASHTGYKSVMSAMLAEVRPAEIQTLTINWGPDVSKPLTPEQSETWAPINLPATTLHADKPVAFIENVHSLTMRDVEVYTVRVVKCNAPKVNVVQVFNGPRIVAMSELCMYDQLPRPQQVENKAMTVTLDVKRGENGMVIKNSDGDWGIIKGCRLHTVEGTKDGEPLVIPGQLEASLTLLSPFRVGRFTMTERGLWQRLGLPGAAPRRFEMFGTEGVSVDMEACTIQLGRDCKHIAEFVAAVFSIWI